MNGDERKRWRLDKRDGFERLRLNLRSDLRSDWRLGDLRRPERGLVLRQSGLLRNDR